MSKEELDQAKDEIKNDLSRGFIKMNYQRLFTVIGCTITICLTVFGAILHLENTLSSHEYRIQKLEGDQSSIKTDIHSLWSEAGTLQGQINDQVRQTNSRK